MRLTVLLMVVGLVLAQGAANRAGSRQQNRSRTIAPGRCGPVDPSYIRVANETGGQPFFFSPTELDKSTHVMLETSRTDSQLLLWANAAAGGQVREYRVPLDSSVRRVTIAASFDSPDGVLHVLSPDGTPAQSLEGVDDTVYTCGHFVTVDRPVTGAWTLRVATSGRYWLTVHAQSELALDAAFVERADGGGAFRRIPGQPVAGRPVSLHAELSTVEIRSGSLHFMSEDGRLLPSPEYAIDVARREFTDGVEIPDRPFRVAATGVDAKGTPFQRVHAALFRAAVVELRLADAETSLVAGRENRVTVVVRNSGAARTFRLVALTGSVPVTVSPSSVALDSGAETTVSVVVTVPADTPAGRTIVLTITAEGAGDPRATNAVVHELIVRERQPASRGVQP